MKINHTENVQVFRLNHNGLDYRYVCHAEPMRYFENTDIKPAGTATIIFEDSREVDQLIDILTNYRNALHAKMGNWKNVSTMNRMCKSCEHWYADKGDQICMHCSHHTGDYIHDRNYYIEKED